MKDSLILWPRWISKRARRFAGRLSLVIAWTVVVLGALWAIPALWFDSFRIPWLAGSLCILYAVSSVALLVFIRPMRGALVAALSLLLLVILWWNLIPSSNDRNWSPEVARLAHATLAGNKLTIANVRNADYRTETDFTEHWETRTYDLDKLRGVDVYLSFWGPTLIAHTIVSWEFENGPPLAISIETRKERCEEYSAIRGLYRQFELYYVVADERDIVRLRTNIRGEHVYLYRIKMDPQSARVVLLDYLEEVNRLGEKPRWYNAVTHNCTTTIRHHALNAGGGNPWDWRILVNGHVDELLYERGSINTSLPFPEMKERSDITEKAKSANAAPDFSVRIRKDLPARIEIPSAHRKK